MKRAVWWVVGAGATSMVLMWALLAQDQQIAQAASKNQPAAPATPAAPAAPATPEKIAFTFADQEQMKQFAQVWAQRQAMITKMAVLQSYWNQEQAGLTKLNEELLSKYNIDTNKNYSFDAQRKVLIERETPPATAASAIGQAPGTGAGAAGTPATAPAKP